MYIRGTANDSKGLSVLNSCLPQVDLSNNLKMDSEAHDPEAQSVKKPKETVDEEQKTRPGSEYDVFWKEPVNEDPENPMNWSGRRKWTIIGMVSFITFLT